MQLVSAAEESCDEGYSTKMRILKTGEAALRECCDSIGNIGQKNFESAEKFRLKLPAML